MCCSSRKLIKAFSIDVNSDQLGQPAAPSLYTQADAREHIKWYCDLGANMIQTFCVSLNGFAWYRSKIAPVNPGMGGDFLKEQIDLGHQHGMEVHGYFCLAGNAWYQAQNREETSIIDRRKAIPLTTKYLDYFCRVVEEAARENELDGVLIDWFEEIVPIWIPAEKQLYEELSDEKFPQRPVADQFRSLPPYSWFGEIQMPVYLSDSKVLDFRKRATIRAWKRIHEAIKSANPDCQIWLNVPFSEPDEPLWAANPIFKDVDMMLTERCDLRIARWLGKETGGKPVLVNLGNLGSYDTNSWEQIVQEGFHLYAFCQPDPSTTLPTSDKKSMIEQVTRAFRGS